MRITISRDEFLAALAAKVGDKVHDALFMVLESNVRTTKATVYMDNVVDVAIEFPQYDSEFSGLLEKAANHSSEDYGKASYKAMLE